MSVVLPQFVFHIADSMNVAAIIRRISERTIREINLIYGPPLDAKTIAPTLRPLRQPERRYYKITAHTGGFLAEILTGRLKMVAQAMPEWSFYVQPLVGNFISPGETLVLAEVPEKDTDAPFPARMGRVLEGAFDVGDFRSYEQDVLFGVRQLVDIAIKAISPAVNDPTTAINCLNHLGVIVGRQAQAPPRSLAALNAPPNLYLKDFPFSVMVDMAFDQIFQWGKQDPVVTRHLLSSLYDVVLVTRHSEYLQVLQKQVADMEIEQLNYPLAEQRQLVRERWQQLMLLFNLSA